MSTSKKSLLSSAAPAADAVVRFSIGAAEVAAADAARDAVANEAEAFRAFYNSVVVAHQLPFSAILPREKDAPRRSNEEQAAYDFALRMFWVYLFGADIAAKMVDRNVDGKTVLPISQFINRLGKPYKDQPKRSIQSSFGGKPWKEFVSRLCELEAADELAMKIATGELTEAEAEAAGKGANKSTKSGLERAIAKVNDAIKSFNREADAEKGDGSVDPLQAAKVAAMLLDVLVAQGWAAKPANAGK